MEAKLFFGILLFLGCYLLKAQDDSVQRAARLSELSLEELMDISIYSVSKTEETTFEAPLASSVITREQIQRAGCTSIMEALRLVPGVIVRQQTNGNYDIHLRGLDNVPPNSSMFFFANSTTLVMIDNRPVYNYLHGGTFWETLPVDLNDVERIEVVRGPSSAMYGPNAVSGVINIITRKPEKEGLYLVANAQYGNFQTAIANTSLGYKFNDKFSAIVSGNLQNRERTQSDYYDVARNEFVPLDSVTSIINTEERYPHPELAMRKYGYNAFFDYKINQKASLSVQGGGQNSEVQNLFASDYLTTSKANTYYGDFKAAAYGFNLQVSYLTGTQSPNTGVLQWKWDFNTTDVVLDYNFTKVKNLSIRPGISYRRAAYDDSPYVQEEIKEGFWNGKSELTTIAAFLRADYKLFKEKLRLVAAGRLDHFNAPDKLYFSWQLAATYKLNERNLVRIVHSRANRSPLIIDTYISTDVITQVVTPAGTQDFEVQLFGNENLDLLTNNMLEIGYRGRIKDNMEIDIVMYGTKTEDYSNIVVDDYDTTTSGLIRYRAVFQNLTVSAFQIGGTISINYVLDKFQFKPFIAIQQTTLYDYSPYSISPDAPPSPFYENPDSFNTQSGIGTEMHHIGTPTIYGGAYINCELGSNFNLNLNPYFFSNHTQLTNSNLTYEDGERGVQHIRAKLILNITLSYTIAKKLTLFTNFRNCFNDKAREFYKSDTPDFKVLGGASFEF